MDVIDALSNHWLVNIFLILRSYTKVAACIIQVVLALDLRLFEDHAALDQQARWLHAHQVRRDLESRRISAQFVLITVFVGAIRVFVRRPRHRHLDSRRLLLDK